MNMQVMSSERVLSPKELINYFEPPPKAAYILILIGIVTLVFPGGLCAALSFVQNPPSILLYLFVFSIPLDLGCILLIMYHSQSRPTDEKYNTWVNSWRSSIRQYGIKKLGLEPSDIVGEPLYVRGIVWPDSPEAMHYHNHSCPVRIKRGKDGHPHASIYRFTFFYPTQHYIAVFSGDVNALSPLRYEATQTYFYDDIVGVETTALGIQLEMVTYSLQRFELRVSSGQSIGATIYAQDVPIEQTVQSLRVLLRDKKYGINGGGRGWAGY